MESDRGEVRFEISIEWDYEDMTIWVYDKDTSKEKGYIHRRTVTEDALLEILTQDQLKKLYERVK